MADYQVRKKHIEPLWDRVDRNRIRLVVFLIVFFIATTLGLTLFIGFALVIVLVVAIGGAPEVATTVSMPSIANLFYLALAGCGVIVFLYMITTLARDERWFIRRMEAALSPKNDLLTTKYALKDMAIASGFEVAPALYVIETPNVNAFVYQKGRRRAIVGATRGLTERLTADEQRAVFANLMARLQQGDTLWASAVTALMAPLWRVRETRMEKSEEVLFVRQDVPAYSNNQAQATAVRLSEAEMGGMFVLAAFVVISEFLVYGHRVSQLKHAETADAEGMLLLKDPRSMLSALEKAVRFNNFVPTAGPGMTQLFYCWTGESSTDDDQDPEMRRVTRLREVLGVEGMAPPVVAENEASYLVAPPAPRLDEE